MPSITTDELADILVLTQAELGELKFNQFATDLVSYEVWSHIWKKDRVQFQAGESISRNVMTKHSGAARQVGLASVDNVNIASVMTTLTAPWRHTETSYAVIRQEMLMNRSPRKLVDLVKVRRTDAMISLIELIEDQFFGDLPAADNDLDILNLKYYVVANATEGFNGGAPSGYTLVAGINPTTQPKWRNYTAQYAQVSKGDLVSKMRTGFRKIGFKSPISISDYRRGGGAGERYRIYMNETTIKQWETLAEEQNDNLGKDLAPFDGMTSFKRNPIVYVPSLDDTTSPTNPVYMLDWGYVEPFFLKGDYLHEERGKSADQHNVINTFIDTTWNLLFTQRRHQAVFVTAT